VRATIETNLNQFRRNI